jgi:hypothetical protein
MDTTWIWVTVVVIAVIVAVGVLIYSARADKRDREQQAEAYRKFAEGITQKQTVDFLKNVNKVLSSNKQRTLNMSVDAIKRFMFSKNTQYRAYGYVYVVNVMDDEGSKLRVDVHSIYDGMSIYQYSDFFEGSTYVKRAQLSR